MTIRRRLFGWSVLALAGVGVLGMAALAVAARLVPRPADLGVHAGRLAPCPATPNCVSSQADDPEHRIEPIAFSGGAADAMRRLRAIVAALPRTQVLVDGPSYLAAVSRSPTFGYPDDLEFLIDEANHLIQVRSGARLGRSDLGVNRRRMEGIEQAFREAENRERAGAAASFR